jgi:prolyl 4-hydroxylase
MPHKFTASMMINISQGTVLVLALLRVAASSEQQGLGVPMELEQEFTLTMVSGMAGQETASGDSNTTAGEEDYNDLSEEALYYGLDLGVPQTLFDDFEEMSVGAIIEARKYMEAEVWVEGAPNPSCRNEHESCAYWAAVGACDENEEFMAINCAPLCWSCNHSAERRLTAPSFDDENCPVDYGTNTWQPGDLDKMFERIATDPAFASLEPRVLSRPTLAPGDDLETADYVVGGPWMVVFDSAVTEQEADRLVEMGGMEGYERSLDVTETFADGSLKQEVSAGRTSTNAWCTGPCAEDASAQAVADRMETITGIPEKYAENFQLLRYTEGQFYHVQ